MFWYMCVCVYEIYVYGSFYLVMFFHCCLLLFHSFNMLFHCCIKLNFFSLCLCLAHHFVFFHIGNISVSLCIKCICMTLQGLRIVINIELSSIMLSTVARNNAFNSEWNLSENKVENVCPPPKQLKCCFNFFIIINQIVSCHIIIMAKKKILSLLLLLRLLHHHHYYSVLKMMENNHNCFAEKSFLRLEFWKLVLHKYHVMTSS